MLRQRAGSQQIRPPRVAGPLFEQGERDARPAHWIDVLSGQPPVPGEPYRRRLETSQRTDLPAVQVQPTRQILGEASVCSRDEPVGQLRRQCRILGQSVESMLHSTIVPAQALARPWVYAQLPRSWRQSRRVHRPRAVLLQLCESIPVQCEQTHAVSLVAWYTAQRPGSRATSTGRTCAAGTKTEKLVSLKSTE